jgi:GT2 family glycosyltransferase
MRHAPLISIITINYNQTDTTCAFLESARHLTYPNYELLIVDNASAESPVEQITQGQYPNVKIIRNEKNLGFTGGNNVGIAAATGDYLFIVNNDTELTPNLLERLLEPFQADERVGVTCPKIRYFYNRDVIQYAGYRPLNKLTGQTGAVGTHEVDHGQYNHSGPTCFAHGCAMMVRREVIERVGRFAERFFLYYEELDWSQRIQNAGYLIYYQASALIYHKESVSVGKTNPLKVYYLTRNRILFMRRNTNRVQLTIFYAFFLCFALPKHSFVYSINGQFAYLKAIWRGTWWNLISSSESPV